MSFTARLTEPTWTEPYWIETNYGGYNQCLVIDANTGLVVPNCTGYAWGRFMEAGGMTTCTLSTGNATNWYGNTGDGYSRGSEPQVGAVICFSGGSSGLGHVAVVEQYAGSYIVCSESDYGGNRFTLRTRYRADNWIISGSTTVFQGFIYNPNVSPSSGQLKLWMIQSLLRRRKNNESKRTIYV